MRVICERHPSLRAFGVRFADGVAEVHNPAILAKLQGVQRRFGLRFEPLDTGGDHDETTSSDPAQTEADSDSQSGETGEPHETTSTDPAESEADSDSQLGETGGDGDPGSSQDPAGELHGALIDLVENANTTQLVGFVTDHPELRDEAIALEQAARARKSALDQLAKISS